MEGNRRESRVEKVGSGVRSSAVAANDSQNFFMYLFSPLFIFCDVLLENLRGARLQNAL